MSEEKTRQEREPGMVLGRGQKPWATKEAAEGIGALKHPGYVAVEHKGGWALVPGTEAAESAETVDEMLDHLPPAAPVSRPVAPAPTPRPVPSGPVGKVAERVDWVMFHAKRHPSEPDDVVLGVNGEVLQLQREVEFPLPYRFQVAATNTKYPHFRQVPGELRKTVGTIWAYPFDVLRPSSLADFQRFRTAGNKATAEARKELSIN